MATTIAFQKASLQRDIKPLLLQTKRLSEEDFGGDKEDPVLFVDVSDGREQLLADICSEQANQKGCMIIQDLQGVLDDWKSLADVEVMLYDFFDPQPISV